MKIIVLDLSYNSLFEVPAQIGELQVLRELRLSINKISSLPREIGKIPRLRKLILNGNRLRSIPAEVGKLQLLEELILSENQLEDIPSSIAGIAALRLLHLQNNKLKTLPFELSEVQTLEEMDCSNNESLEMVPKKWRGDMESILFVCRIHRTYHIRMDEMTITNEDLSKHSQYLEQQQLLFMENIIELKNEIGELKRNMPKTALAKYERDAKVATERTASETAGEKKSGCVIS